jgi:hypothetical protein
MTVAISTCLAINIVTHHRLEWWSASKCWEGKVGELHVAITFKEGYALLEYV